MSSLTIRCGYDNNNNKSNSRSKDYSMDDASMLLRHIPSILLRACVVFVAPGPCCFGLRPHPRAAGLQLAASPHVLAARMKQLNAEKAAEANPTCSLTWFQCILYRQQTTDTRTTDNRQQTTRLVTVPWPARVIVVHVMRAH